MDKNIRIAIIGGGPAGLSAGMYLEKKGYENYVIYERQDRVGGKCWSPHYNGRRYEMGAPTATSLSRLPARSATSSATPGC